MTICHDDTSAEKCPRLRPLITSLSSYHGLGHLCHASIQTFLTYACMHAVQHQYVLYTMRGYHESLETVQQSLWLFLTSVSC